MTLLGIVGTKGVGKDTLGDFLVRHHDFQKRAFAAPIKNACALLFQLPPETFEDPVEKERVVPRHGMSPRQMMQLVGTDMFRQQVHPDFWVRHFVAWYESLSRSDNIVVTDIRFQNEVDLLKDLGATIIRVTRPGAETLDLHVSEQGVQTLTGVDVTLDNAGSKEDLWRQVDMAAWQGKKQGF